MNEDRFWQMIDAAWKSSPENAAFQRALEDAIGDETKRDAFVERYFDDDDLGMIADESTFLAALTKELEGLSKEDLIAFDRILERKLYDIDREEIQAVTDGSDDGFLYCRGFIVACGKRYYDAVNLAPENGLCDFECEEMTYISFQAFEERFEDEFPDSDISRESCSNKAAWPSLDN
ncbi:DUF4240 domain-containing protein [Alienimonas chondri]|uniref:DUF4240 domain-containing protein n=1 Tax=Alienimonas chondri TaxID=2681879 RepID=A0ABX1VCI9_9PLAN|nr:DUF4240 domain-containing protein [Alienimonas chondri]NNJ24766.1 hypothetical protein [Alienimonas chondri]